MPTINQVQIAIDQQVQAKLAAARPVVYDNVEETEFYAGTDPFFKVETKFNETGQFELGLDSKRHRGSLLVFVYVRKNTGPAVRNQMQQLVVDNFCNTTIGGARFLGSTTPVSGYSTNWQVLGIRIPFSFEQY